MYRLLSKALLPHVRIRRVEKTQLFSYQTEVISYDDTQMFPHESGFIQNSIYNNKIEIPICTLDQYVWMNINRFHDKPAVACHTNDKYFTYAKLRDNCGALAYNLLHKLKLKYGNVVSVCLPNVPEFIIATLGVIEAGLIVSTVNPVYTATEIANQLINSNSKILIGTVENYENLSKAVKLAQKDIKIVCTKTNRTQSIPVGAIDLAELTDTNGVSFVTLDNNKIVDSNATTMLPYSSGTTGLPKGVELTHKNLISNAEMICQPLQGKTICLPTTNDFQDVLPCVLPFFHIYGWTCTMISKLRLGCKLVTLNGFKPDLFLDCLTLHKATVLHLVPPIVIFLSHYNKVTSKHTDHLRIITSGAAPLGYEDVERFTQKAPQVEFSQGYGLTESSPVALMQYIGSKNFASVGSPSPATQAKIVKIDDSTMKALGPNDIGEILLRGPHIMKGYLNNEKATDETLVNGWLKTGDIGYYDENAQFYVTDRLKELIKVKGFQVAPAELEEVLRSHPKVADAAVIGVPHKQTGEAPKGFIVLKPNTAATEKEILEFVAQKVAPYKRLEGIVITKSIPKNETGKILKRKLKEQYLQ